MTVGDSQGATVRSLADFFSDYYFTTDIEVSSIGLAVKAARTAQRPIGIHTKYNHRNT